MLRRNTRYILAQLTAPFLVIACALVGVVLLSQSLRFVDLMINRGLDVKMFLYLTGLLAPSLLLVSLPAAAFIAVTTVYRRLIRDSELVALNACGASPAQMAKPAAILGIFVAGALYVVSLYALPTSYRHFKDTQFLIRNRYATMLLQEGTFISPVKDVTIYLEEYDPSGRVRGVFVYDNRKARSPVAMTAKEGEIVRTLNGPAFILRQGARHTTESGGRASNALFFKEYRLDLSAYSDERPDRKWREAEEYYLGEMRSLLADKNLPDKLRGKLTSEMHFRLSWPAFAFFLSVMPLTALLGGEFSRRGRWKRVATACGAAIVATGGQLGIKALIANSPGLAWTPYAYLSALGLICVYIIVILPRHMRIKAQKNT